MEERRKMSGSGSSRCRSSGRGFERETCKGRIWIGLGFGGGIMGKGGEGRAWGEGGKG